MVGDYFSVSIPPGSNVAVPAFMVASAPTGTTFHQPTFAVREDIAGGNRVQVAVSNAEPTIGAQAAAVAAAATPRLTVFPTVR